MELYATAFDRAGALDKLEAFASFNGADFYGLPRNKDHVVLMRAAWTVPDAYEYGQAELKPLGAGETLEWKLA
jgi:dihydroorotase